MTTTGLRKAAAALVLALVAAGCSSARETAAPTAEESPRGSATEAQSTPAGHGTHGTTTPSPAASKPLRAGERRATLAMPEAYTPSAPYSAGTDDYRCFVLDPHLRDGAFITGLNILPGNPEVVHHVILFKVSPDSLEAVEEKDAAEEGQGWTCFGGTGVESEAALQEDASWLGAWAPGGSEQVLADDVGVPMEKGSRVIMQVHYNLLAGPRPDVTSAQLRLTAATEKLAPLETMLLPAPVELPCRPGHEGPLCDRDAAVTDAEARFGPVAQAANYLHLLCGRLEPGPVQTCDRTMSGPATLRAVAGHMHLLGRSISVQVNPGTPRARTVLDVPVWDFDNQGARTVKPVKLRAGDKVRVTCRHDQALRDVLPAFRGQRERYVIWGEGTTDEMCLGILLLTRP
jgi:hypothetical protein